MGVWEIEFTDQFGDWWDTLTADEQQEIARIVDLLKSLGPRLSRPHADRIKSSRHHNMKELRISNTRILFAFDPTSSAILLIGGNKTGQWATWYDRMIPVADDLYDEHLEELRRRN